MTEVVFGIGLFTGIVMALVLTVLAARAVLVRAVPVVVTVNADRALAAKSGQKLLEALQANDILIPSACAGAGTCGLCRVEVVDGGGQALATEQSKFSKAELRDGMRLACQLVLRQDVKISLPDDVLGTESWDCTVFSNRWLAPLIRELVLELPEGATPNLRAGAFVQVTAPAYDLDFQTLDVPKRFDHIWDQTQLKGLTSRSPVAVTRAYSIANRPEDVAKVVLNIRLALPPPAIADAPPGVVSSYLFAATPGQTLALSGPYGSFGAQVSEREMVFIGGGVGMEPLRAIIFDQLTRLKTSRRMSYWYGARSGIELFYEDEFNQLQADHPNFNWTVALSDPKPEDAWDGPVGFIHDVVIEAFLKAHPAPEVCEYYLCGPPLMIRAVMAMLEDYGVDPSSIFNDDFGV